MDKIVVELDGRCDAVVIVRSVVQVLSQRVDLNVLQRNRVGLAVDEVYANIVRHGYHGEGGRVRLEARVQQDEQGGCLYFCFQDDAPPVDMSDCDCGSDMPPCSAETLEPGGLGIPLIHAIMDEVHHTMLEHGNQWDLMYRCIQEGTT